MAVFVDGCFWHPCPIHGTRPSRNADYWLPKLDRNVERDREQVEALVANGWQALRIWEREGIAEATERIMKAVNRPNPPLEG